MLFIYLLKTVVGALYYFKVQREDQEYPHYSTRLVFIQMKHLFIERTRAFPNNRNQVFSNKKRVWWVSKFSLL